MSEREWWEPVLCDDGYFERLRDDYPEHADWTDDELNERYNNGRRYQCLWDHVGDAYRDWEPLADAYLKLKAEIERLRRAPTALDVVERVREWLRARKRGEMNLDLSETLDEIEREVKEAQP